MPSFNQKDSAALLACSLRQSAAQAGDKGRLSIQLAKGISQVGCWRRLIARASGAAIMSLMSGDRQLRSAQLSLVSAGGPVACRQFPELILIGSGKARSQSLP
jgi:hypothetical protein